MSSLVLQKVFGAFYWQVLFSSLLGFFTAFISGLDKETSCSKLKKTSPWLQSNRIPLTKWSQVIRS
jgi:hypothetical protein